VDAFCYLGDLTTAQDRTSEPIVGGEYLCCAAMIGERHGVEVELGAAGQSLTKISLVS
jgi:hypothetical protein